jgi:hypothetical protein
MDGLHKYKLVRISSINQQIVTKILVVIDFKKKVVFAPHNKLEINSDLSNTFKSLLLPTKKCMLDPQTTVNNYFQNNQLVIIFVSELPLPNSGAMLPTIVHRV